MATRYVSTTGSDAADGSTGTPWLTIGGANNNAGDGDVIKIREGTYAGDDLSTGSIRIVRGGSFVTGITFEADDTTKRPVLTGLNDVTAFGVLLQQNKVTFRNLTIRLPASTSATSTKTGLRINASTCSDLTLEDVTIDASQCGANGLIYGLLANFTGTLTNLTLRRVTIIPSAVNPAGFNAANFIGVSGGVTGFVGEDIISVGHGFSLENVSGTLTRFSGTTQTGCSLLIGRDSHTGGLATTVDVTTAVCVSVGNATHGSLLGDGATGCTIDGLFAFGADYSFVQKGEGSNVVTNSYFGPGRTAGKSSVLLKGGNGLEIYNSTIVADVSGGECFAFTQTDIGGKTNDLNIHDNRLIALNGAQIYDAATANVGTGNVFDSNLIYLDDTSSLGTVLASTPAEVSDLPTAWGSTNDARTQLMTGDNTLVDGPDPSIITIGVGASVLPIAVGAR